MRMESTKSEKRPQSAQSARRARSALSEIPVRFGKKMRFSGKEMRHLRARPVAISTSALKLQNNTLTSARAKRVSLACPHRIRVFSCVPAAAASCQPLVSLFDVDPRSVDAGLTESVLLLICLWLFTQCAGSSSSLKRLFR
jgi:hypothetical protein